MDQYPDLYSQVNPIGLERAGLYDFISEVSPGVWKVCRKIDRIEFLACDVTEQLQLPTGHKSQLMFLLDPKTNNITAPIMCLLNHENLVCLVDWIESYHSNTAKLGSKGCQPPRPRHFMLWDFCDAGSLDNMFLPQLDMTEEERQHKRNKHFEAKNQRGGYQFPTKSNKFLPESFVWHVMCSILKALTWLHHGIRDHYNAAEGRWEQHRADMDWQTVLHRDIRASNIFFQHPRQNETYGMCKLGNYSKAFVSGHVNGILGNVVKPAAGKVLAARDGHVDLNILRFVDSGQFPLESEHPSSQEPYSILSEYHALGNVILAMMTEPVKHDFKRDEDIPPGDAHVRYVRNRPNFWKIFHDLEYSKLLRNMVYDLVSCEDTKPMSTLRLYMRAKTDYLMFRSFKRDGTELLQVEHVLAIQAHEDARERAHNLRLTRKIAATLEMQDRKLGRKKAGPSGIMNEIDAALHDFSRKYD